VHRRKNKAAFGGQSFDVPSYVVSDLSRGATIQDDLRIDATSPEDQVPPELPFELKWVHSCRTELHRIEDINPDLDQIGDDRADGAARVVEQLDRSLPLMNENKR